MTEQTDIKEYLAVLAKYISETNPDPETAIGISTNLFKITDVIDKANAQIKSLTEKLEEANKQIEQLKKDVYNATPPRDRFQDY